MVRPKGAISRPHTIRILRKRKRAAAKLRARGLPLQLDPSSFEGLELTGKISRLVRIALQARGIERLDDLERISLADLLRLPNIGRRSATTLADLYAERKRSHKGRRADQ